MFLPYFARPVILLMLPTNLKFLICPWSWLYSLLVGFRLKQCKCLWLIVIHTVDTEVTCSLAVIKLCSFEVSFNKLIDVISVSGRGIRFIWLSLDKFASDVVTDQ